MGGEPKAAESDTIARGVERMGNKLVWFEWSVFLSSIYREC